MAKKKAKVDYSDLSLEELVEQYAQKGKRIMKANEIQAVGRIPIGYSELDKQLGGGIPRARITELFGRESSSKTLLAMAAVASAQRMGGVALWLDAEKTFDVEWAIKNGVDVDSLFYFRPSSGDEGYEILKSFLGKVDIAVVDSVAAMVPEAELAGGIGDANIGLHARLNSGAMRHINDVLDDGCQTALIFINQVRTGGMMGQGAGPQDVTTGGRALAFYASLRLRMVRIGWVKQGEDIVGGLFQAELRKAKITGAKDRTKVEFEVDFECGLDFAADIMKRAVDSGLVSGGPQWFTLEDGTKIQGKQNLKSLIRQDLQGWRDKLALSGDSITD